MKGAGRPSAEQVPAVQYGLGLMSGSSCDGIDAALVRLAGNPPRVHVDLVAFETFPYDPAFKSRLLSHAITPIELAVLNMDLGERLAGAAADMKRHAAEKGITLNFVASHGHTLAHVPPRVGRSGTGSLQIGEAAVIAERCGVQVVSDFRLRDMAAGGQGAPLVPYADWLLFHHPEQTRCCLNIGGIANVTVVTPNLDDVYAFDTGPGNMPIDGAVRVLTKGHQHYDKDGQWAARGAVLSDFWERLTQHPYFGWTPPKSTGREEFDAEVWLGNDLAKWGKPADILATITSVVGLSIAEAIHLYVKPNRSVDRLIVSGGGAYNQTLMRNIQEALPDGMQMQVSDEYGFPADAREAIAFALLGYATIRGKPSNVPSATGARHPVVLGSITPA